MNETTMRRNVAAGFFLCSVLLGCGRPQITDLQAEPGLVPDATPEATPDATPVSQWLRTFGDSTQYTTDVVVAANGEVLLAGMFHGTVDFGAGAVTAPSDWAPFLVRYSPSGTVKWVRTFSGWQSNADGFHTPRMALAPDGSIVLAGSYHGPLDLGGGPLQYDQASFDLFVARFSADGQTQWAKGFSAPLYQGAAAVAVDSAGAAWVTGNFQGSLTFGATKLTEAGGGDIFLARLSATGEVLNARSIGDVNQQQAMSLAATPDDGVVLVGGMVGTIDFGAAGTVNSRDLLGFDAFAVRVASTGDVKWAHAWGDAGRQALLSVRVDPTGGIALLGIFSGTLHGLGDLVATDGADRGGSSAFLARLDAQGALEWSRSLGLVDFNFHSSLDVLALDSQQNLHFPLSEPNGDISLHTISAQNAVVSKRTLPGGVGAGVRSLAVSGASWVLTGAGGANGQLLGVPATPPGGRNFVARVTR